MQNPNGPYPGRQLFLGLTADSKPCFAYLVSGRSPASRERTAVPIENGIRIGPLGGGQYDALRHYSAVKYDPLSGLLAVTNGIQTEAIFESYKLIFNTGNQPGKEYLEKLLEGAGAEPDPPLNTPRIAGVVTRDGEGWPVFIIGIKSYGKAARAREIEARKGTLTGISVYQGDMEKPEGTDPNAALPTLEFKGKSPKQLASFLFDISAASYKGADIRVCALGGILADNRKWDIAIQNVYTV